MMASYRAEPRRSTRNQTREEKQALENALALSLGHAGSTEDAAVPCTPSGRKREVISKAPMTPPKKPKTVQIVAATPNGDAWLKPSPGWEVRLNQTNTKVSKESVARSVSVTVKQWLQDGLYAGDKDLQARTERFAAIEASWLGQVQRGREKDHLIRPPPAGMEYVYFHNGKALLVLGTGDAPYHQQPRKTPRKTPREEKLARSPPNKDKSHKYESSPEAVTGSNKLLRLPVPEFSPHVDSGLQASVDSSAVARSRDILGPGSSDLDHVPLRDWNNLAASSVVARPESSALFPPIKTVRVGFSFGPISALVQYRYGRNSPNQKSATQEEAFAARPSIKILVPDTLKGLLVDDWENITKNNQLVPIPHPTPVSKILEDYVNYEKPQRPENSASVDILEETVAGLKEYFDKSLGRILLYR